MLIILDIVMVVVIVIDCFSQFPSFNCILNIQAIQIKTELINCLAIDHFSDSDEELNMCEISGSLMKQ